MKENGDDDWPIIELIEPKLGVLSQFSSSAGESVAHILIRELVDKVDRSPTTSRGLEDAFSNDQDLEWIMQVINHAMTLSFTPSQSYETLRSAVRIYIAWSSALTDTKHLSCPKQILLHPDKYFKKFLEAFRHIFQSKSSSSLDGVDTQILLSRQGTQIQTVLIAIRHLTNSTIDEYRDDVWARCLLFLLNINEQLISIGASKSQESIGCLMAHDICQSLFDCWLKAALNECIPSPAYWKTFSSMSWRCGAQVQFIECWASALLRSTALLLQHLYGQHSLENVAFESAFEPFSSTFSLPLERLNTLKDVWQNLFLLLGRPVAFIQHAFALLASKQFEPSATRFFSDQLTLSFFLIILAFKKMADLFFGDPVSLDFNESEELHSQWLEAALTSPNKSIAQEEHGSDTEMTAVQISGQVRAQQHVWFILRNNPFVARSQQQGGGSKRFPLATSAAAITTTGKKHSSSSLLDLFLEWLFDASLLRLSPSETAEVCTTYLSRASSAAAAPSSTSGQKCCSSSLLRESASSSSSGNSSNSSKSSNISAGLAGAKRPPSATATVGHSQATTTAGTTIITTTTLRRSFATSISRSSTIRTSSMLGAGGDTSFPVQQRSGSVISPTEFPSVDGISSGRATALSTLCKIVCAKHTYEQLHDEQLARFFSVMHEAFLSKDRIVLCSLLFFADNLFKLALKGVHILLPNYVQAIELVHKESFQQHSLHPSIGQAEMRDACLRALASILPWPSVFGWANIFEGLQHSPPSFTSASSELSQKHANNQQKNMRQSSFSSIHSNLIEPSAARYADLRKRIQRILMCSLRQENDPLNIQFAFGLSAIFCVEAAEHELRAMTALTNVKEKNKFGEKGNLESPVDVEAPSFSISLVRSIVSAVCDNLCKPTWASEILCCLAAFDCLNSLSSLPHNVLFSKGELSTGSLIVSSLCRFIDQQLKKPPPLHSRDMHSTVVAAYFCMGIWLKSAPKLADIESCLNTIALSIELGMTGGHQLTVDQYKPASQRVHDAAEALLHTLFSLKTSTEKNRGFNSAAAINEMLLVHKLGLRLDKFQHFMLQQHTLLSLHEAQHLTNLSKGFPAVIAIFRTPFSSPLASVIRLTPKVLSTKKNNMQNDVLQNAKNVKTSAQQQSQMDHTSPGCTSIQSFSTTTSGGGGDDHSQQTNASVVSNSSGVSSASTTKHFEIPPECLKPKCELDRQFPKLEPVPPQVCAIQAQLEQIQERLASGKGAPIGDRDSRNVWLNTSLGALLSRPPTAESPVAHCNSLRVFLYDMGLVNMRAYLSELTPLDSSSYDIFYDSLAVTVDQHPVWLTEAVSLFYVKEGQQNAEDILQNNIDLRQTSTQYCRLLHGLGNAMETRTLKHNGGASIPSKNEGFVLDGIDHCLRWRDSHMEIIFITPTGRTLAGIGVTSVRKMTTVASARAMAQHLNLEEGSKLKHVVTSTVSQSSRLNESSSPQHTATHSSNSMEKSNNRTLSCASTGGTESIHSKSTEQQPSSSSTVSHQKYKTLGKGAKRSTDLRIFVVWLERLEDMNTFPIEEMFPFTAFGHQQQQQQQLSSAQQQSQQQGQIDHLIFYLFQFERGLLRVQVDGIWTKLGKPGPLHNGTVVSSRALPALLRQTVCNVARRMTVEIENYQMTHLRRKQAIAEFGRRFATRLSYSEFVEQLLLTDLSTTTFPA